MLEIGVFHNGASSLPVITTKDGVTLNDGSLAEDTARRRKPGAPGDQTLASCGPESDVTLPAVQRASPRALAGTAADKRTVPRAPHPPSHR